MARSGRTLILGRVLRPHGVRGVLRARFEVTDPSWIKPGIELLVGETHRELLRFSGAPGGPPFFLIELAGISSRDDAAAIKGADLAIQRDALPELAADDDFYVEDLVGLNASDSDGHALGKVERVTVVAGRILAHVAVGLIPLDGDVIAAIDFDQRTVVFTLPPGLFEAQS